MLTFFTLNVIIAFAAGLLVGWNLLPQPEWVKDLWAKIVGPKA